MKDGVFTFLIPPLACGINLDVSWFHPLYSHKRSCTFFFYGHNCKDIYIKQWLYMHVKHWVQGHAAYLKSVSLVCIKAQIRVPGIYAMKYLEMCSIRPPYFTVQVSSSMCFNFSSTQKWHQNLAPLSNCALWIWGDFKVLLASVTCI